MSKKQKSRKPSEKPGVMISHVGFEGADHEQFKAAVLASAKQKVEAASTVLEELKSIFQRCDPLQILASCASYGLQGAVSEQGVEQRPSRPSSLEQYHVELLQAVLLTIPMETWGANPAIPPDVQIAYDKIRELADTFLASRLLAHQETDDPQERTAQALSEHIRLHTHVVRNWAYFQDVVAISTDLYGPLDSAISSKAGFSPTDIIKLAEFLTSEWESRLNTRFQTLRRIARQKSARQVMRSYFKEVPDLIGTPEEVLSILPPNLTRMDAFSYVLSHYDLRLRDAGTFTVRQVASGAGISCDAAAKALEFLSLAPGSLEAHHFDHVHLDNPVAGAPAIKLGADFFIALPQVIFTNIHPIIRRLCEKSGESVLLENIRSNFLERKVAETLRTIFPTAQSLPNLKWSKNGKQYETDLVLLIDEVALIVEVKSHQLTPPALRGAAKRLKRHVDDLILNPSIQSSRLHDAIVAARDGEKDSQATCAALGIPYEIIRNVLRLSVSLEDFSILSSSEVELRQAGWLPPDHELAPLISVADLIYLGDILPPPYLLHYLVQRQRVQKQFDLTADEMDFLGMYLETLLNIGRPDETPSRIVFTGMSGSLDRYYMSRDAGVLLPKPTPKVAPYFRKLISRIADRATLGWTTLVISILDCATPDEQRKIVNGLEKLKNSVRKKFRDPKHVCSLHILSPQTDRAGLVFYVYPNVLKDQRVTTMEHFAGEMFVSSGRKRALVIGRCIERWNEPYDTIALLEDNAD